MQVCGATMEATVPFLNGQELDHVLYLTLCSLQLNININKRNLAS